MKRTVVIVLCLSLIMLPVFASCAGSTRSADRSPGSDETNKNTEYVTDRSSGCDHSWIEATCTAPKTCSKCGKEEGSALGHSWSEATCTSPKTCSRCGATEGNALGHDPGSDLYCTVCGAKCTAADFGYLAGSDFRNVRRDDPNAVAEGAYVMIYTNMDGDNCVLTVVSYEIISRNALVTLHNLTQGEEIEDPVDHYNETADSYSGADKIRCMSMAAEAGEMEKATLEALQEIFSGKQPYSITLSVDGAEKGNGAFVDADTLNM